jgi:dihydrofolate reductase
MQTSVDGFVAAATPGPSWQLWDWSDAWTWDAALQQDFNATFHGIDCILLSRKMAEEGYLDHWRGMADRHSGDPRFDFARRVGEAHKIVFSRSVRHSRWERATIAVGEMADVIASLKKANGLDMIAFGGTGFARNLLEAALVDELQLYVNPTAVGVGSSIFEGIGAGLPMTLLGAKPYACGIVVARYAPRQVA